MSETTHPTDRTPDHGAHRADGARLADPEARGRDADRDVVRDRDRDRGSDTDREHRTPREHREHRDDEHRAARDHGDAAGLPVERTVFPPFPKLGHDASFGDRLSATIAWVQSTRPVRVFQHFGQSNGAVLAGGMSYSAIFSLFAAVWALFSIAALVLHGNTPLRDLVISTLSDAAPGLVGEDGVIKPSVLDQAGVFGWTGAIALVGTIWTALGWLSGSRSAIRSIFDVPVSPPTNFVLLKLKDVGIMLAFGVAMLLSSALTVASEGLLKWLGSLIGIGEDAPVSLFILRVVSTLIVIAADTVIMALLIKALSGLRIPPRTLFIGALIGAIMVQVLKQAGSALVGGASKNPIAASFAVLLGVLIFFNLLCTVLLLTASWIKVTMDDLGRSPRKLTAEQADAEAAVAELTARRERLAADRIRLEGELRFVSRFSPRRRRLRRDYDRVLEEERVLLEEDKRRRLGLDEHGYPSSEEPERSEQHGFTGDASRVRGDVERRDRSALAADDAADAASPERPGDDSPTDRR